MDAVVLEEVVDSDVAAAEDMEEVAAAVAAMEMAAVTVADLVEATEMVEVEAVAVVDTEEEEVVEDLVVRLMMSLRGVGIRKTKLSALT